MRFLFSFLFTICSYIYGMDKNELDFIKSEPKYLSEFHSQSEERKARGFLYILPENIEQIEWLYKEYKEGRFVDNLGIGPFPSCSPDWVQIITDIEGELRVRCLDGSLYFIDQYLDRLGCFFDSIKSFHDEDFRDSFYSQLSYDGELFKWVMNMYYLPNSAKEKIREINEFKRYKSKENLEKLEELSKMTPESMHLTYVVERLDKIIKDSGRCGDYSLLESYKKYILDDTYRQSPEYKAIYTAIERAFGKSDE